ncbi:hypothetical protein ACSBR1_035759 [Camellia fascicularis]
MGFHYFSSSLQIIKFSTNFSSLGQFWFLSWRIGETVESHQERYTFILTARKELPKQCTRYGTTTSKYAYRKNVGVRIPDDAVCQVILEKMDAPLISTSCNR